MDRTQPKLQVIELDFLELKKKLYYAHWKPLYTANFRLSLHGAIAN